VSQACQRDQDEYFSPGSLKILGVDVARYGDDRSVIIKRQGLVAFEPMVLQGVDNMTLASKVALEMDAWQPDAAFVDAGRGEGVIDRLRQLGFVVSEVNFGGRPSSEKYANKRSEIWDATAKWLRAGGCLPNHPELKTDLCTPTYSFNAVNKLVLEGKDDIKARGGRSTDVGDALALTFAEPVTPRGFSFGWGGPRSAVEYDRWLAGHRVQTRSAVDPSYDPLSYRYSDRDYDVFADSGTDYDPFADLSPDYR
jgi:hypothetical protein